MFRRLVLSVAVAALASGAAWAQDKDAIKKKILQKVEEKLKAEEEKILKEIEKIIDEELAKLEGRAPAKPSDNAKTQDPPKKEFKPGFLGIGPTEGDEEGVVVIGNIVEGSPAEKAGLQEGDVIVSIGKTKIDSLERLYSAIGRTGAGTKVDVTILRDGKEKKVEATLAERPAAEENPHDEEPAPDEAPVKPSDEGIRERLKKFMEKKGEGPKPESKAPDVAKRVEELLGKAEIQKGLKAAIEQLKKMELTFDDFLKVNEDGSVALTDGGRKALGDRLSALNPETMERRINQLKRFVEEFADAAPESIQERIKSFLKPREPVAAERPLLGVRVGTITDEARAKFDLEEGVGVSIEEVAASSPAEKAGLKAGDILTTIDGRSVKGELDLMKRLRGASAGQEVELKVLREGKEQSVKVKLGGE